MSSPALAWQASLLDAEEPVFDASFSALRRRQLDEASWVDHAAGWLSGSDQVFADLLEHAPWQHHVVHMYGRKVAQPRLTAWWERSSGTLPFLPVIEDMRQALSSRYGVEFDSVGLNLYRDGSDSVAFHGDRIAKEVVDPMVVIVSVGHPRRFLLRPKPSGRATALTLGRGDLLVMGGASQRTWQHSVPKVAAAGPRISITLRHSPLVPRSGISRS